MTLKGIALAQEIENFKHQMPLLIQAKAEQARLLYVHYRQLIDEGFTEEQALEIIKARGIE